MTAFLKKKTAAGTPPSTGVAVAGWLLILSNAVMVGVLLSGLSGSHFEAVRRLTALTAMIAVFPYDLSQVYFFDQWFPQIIWILAVGLCASGLFFLSKVARAVFIIFNIVHIVVLGYLSVLAFDQPDFLEYFFKLYFNLVASGSYVAFLTLEEVRRQFRVDLHGLGLEIFLRTPRGQAVTKADAKRYADLSSAYIKLGRYEAAVDVLKKAIEGDPEAAGHYFQLGLIYANQSALAEARRYFKEAIARDPVHYEAYYNAGVVCVQQGCSREAAEMFLKAVHVRPQEAQAYRDLGDAYFALGRFEDAVAQFREAAARSRGDAYAYYRIGLILGNELDKPHEAREALRAALRANGDFCEAYFELGKACVKLKRYKEGVQTFKEVVRRKSDDARAHYYLGFCYAMLKDDDSARRQYEILKGFDRGLAEDLRMAMAV